MKEKKSAGSCERSLYLQNIPFTAALPLRNLQLCRMGDTQVSVGQTKCVHVGFCFCADCWGLFPSSHLTPLKSSRCSLCSFTLHPAMQDRNWDGDWYCFWHHQLLQGFLSANLWEPDYVLEVVLSCLLIESPGASTVCLFSVGHIYSLWGNIFSFP